MSTQRRSTRQRQLVLDAVRALDNHPTAESVFNVVRAHDAHVSRGTVYRNLNLLAKDGRIQIIKTPGGSRFDWRCHPHAHVMCTSCGAVEDIELPYREELDRDADARTTFEVHSHFTLFEGLCPACRAAAEAKTRP